jgi:hypothetical protein
MNESGNPCHNSSGRGAPVAQPAALPGSLPRADATPRDTDRIPPQPATSGSPGTVWLCVPGRGQDDPALPVWASRTVAEFSAPGERVVIRALASYPGLAGEMAALIGAATQTGRYPVALLPTPASAARTRALLPALLPTAATLGDQPWGASPDELPAQTPDGPGALQSRGAPRGGPRVRPRIGVGRRRPAMEASPAGLVVVLAGPVSAGARAPRRTITRGLISAWARPLRPGGLLMVLRPGELGQRRASHGHGAVVSTAREAGLSYLQHIVLVHVPATEAGLAHPDSTRRPHAPFWPVHTDALVLQTPPDPTEPLQQPPRPAVHLTGMGTAGAAWSSAATDARTDPQADPPTLPVIAAAVAPSLSPTELASADISGGATIPSSPGVSAEQRGEVA